MKIVDLFEMRTDNEDYRDLDRHDRWLAKYTYENLDKWPASETIDTLLTRYPSNKQKIYRGLNFRTKDKFDDFMESLDGDVLTTSSISSWAHDHDSAYQFSIVRPTYFPDEETFKQEKIAREKGEVIRGYCGVILTTTVEQGQGIDVSKSRLGHEPEIILPAGKYKVDVHIERTFSEQFARGDLTTDKFAEMISKTDDLIGDSKTANIWKHILINQQDNLSEENKEKIFSIMKEKSDATIVRYDSYNEGIPTSGVKSEMYDGEVYFNYFQIFFNYAIDGLYPKSRNSDVKRVACEILNKFYQAMDKYPNAYIENGQVQPLVQLCGKEQEYKLFLRDRIGKRYQELNSREHNKTIKTRDQIYKQAKMIELLFKQLRF